jgi:hypothetical protein
MSCFFKKQAQVIIYMNEHSFYKYIYHISMNIFKKQSRFDFEIYKIDY